MARHWNTHKIRPYPNQDTPPGKPDVLFFLPEVTGKMDVLFATLILHKEMVRYICGCTRGRKVFSPQLFLSFSLALSLTGRPVYILLKKHDTARNDALAHTSSEKGVEGLILSRGVTLEFSLSDCQDYQTEFGLDDVEMADENFCKERPLLGCQ